jgi:hypothetical protein
VILKLPLRQMLRIRDLKIVEARNEFHELSFDAGYGPAAGARTTNGTAGKKAAISERDLRSTAVP